MSVVCFHTTILKFSEKGEKTGWTYIVISEEVAQQINPNTKTSFRTKGKLDNYDFSGVALLPMGDGSFIMSLNATIRKAIRKIHGDKIKVEIELDKSEYKLDADFVECLEDDSKAKDFFYSQPKSHQNYFSKWIESSKTNVTKSKRIVLAINALSKKMNYAEMIRNSKSLL